MSVRKLVAVTVVVLGLAASGCQLPVVVGLPGSTPCWKGTFPATEVLANRTFNFDGFAVTAAVTSGTATLATTDSNWTLTANETLDVRMNGTSVGTATVNGSATGSLSANGSVLTFGLTSITGTASFTGVGPAAQYSRTVNLADLGELSDAFGLSGTATVTCGPSPALHFTAGSSHDIDVDL